MQNLQFTYTYMEILPRFMEEVSPHGMFFKFELSDLIFSKLFLQKESSFTSRQHLVEKWLFQEELIYALGLSNGVQIVLLMGTFLMSAQRLNGSVNLSHHSL